MIFLDTTTVKYHQIKILYFSRHNQISFGISLWWGSIQFSLLPFLKFIFLKNNKTLFSLNLLAATIKFSDLIMLSAGCDSRIWSDYCEYSQVHSYLRHQSVLPQILCESWMLSKFVVLTVLYKIYLVSWAISLVNRVQYS